MAGWTQLENLLLECQYQLFFIDPLSEIDFSRILHNPERESRLGLDGFAGLAC